MLLIYVTADPSFFAETLWLNETAHLNINAVFGYVYRVAGFADLDPYEAWAV